MMFSRKPISTGYRKIYPSHHPHSEKERKGQHFRSNRIKTTKYSILTFLPKNLYEQFHRFANLYFVGVVVLDWIPSIQAFGKELSLIPVIFVLSVTAIKDAYEDFRRYRSDRKINNQYCRVWDPGEKRYAQSAWSSIRVGDFVHLGCNEVIPADILILASSDPCGICFVETSNLDGESNLKQRQVVDSQQKKQDAIRELQPEKKNVFKPSDFDSVTEIEQPNNQIYSFNGYIIDSEDKKEAMNKNNILLRGCSLKNTDFVEGMVVYAGHETKSMLSNTGPRYKRSSLEVRMNYDVIWCVVILVLLCFCGALGSGLWIKSYGDGENVKNVPFLVFKDYKIGSKPNAAFIAFISFFSYVIVLQSMIPLALYVSLELIKLGQIYFINRDKELYHPGTDSRIECRALNITEELGQIEYILSDKTGTLTENQMIFRRCAIGSEDYGPEIKDSAPSTLAPSKTVASLTEPNKELLRVTKSNSSIAPGGHESSPKEFKAIVNDFFINLAICNTVVIPQQKHKDVLQPSGSAVFVSESTLNVTQTTSLTNLDVTELSKKDQITLNPDPSFPYLSASNNITPVSSPIFEDLPFTAEDIASAITPVYEAESPDELALVHAACLYGYSLVRRHVNYVNVRLPDGTKKKFELLHTLPFDAVRKRMSVIVRESENEPPVLFCKGADAVIMELLSASFKTTEEGRSCLAKCSEHLDNYASYGLRTLCVTKRKLSHEEYSTWLSHFKAADLAVEYRAEKLIKTAEQIEVDLELLGVTGVEDRLQTGVPATIKSLRDAGIKVWVLTGDKLETAVNVAHASKLFSAEMDILQLKAHNQHDVEEMLEHHVQQLDNHHEVTVTNSIEGTGNLSKQRKMALVIDGKTLSYCMRPEPISNLIKLASNCSSVLCCRATPIQKAEVVKLVKEKLRKKTLAIGDGANDVAMIQSSDVGVGINGQEGMQAVMASDFALPRFRFLSRLLLVHGHWSYDRLARTILYFFYENALFVFALCWFQIFSGFSQQTTVDPMYLVLYSVIFTGLPPLVMGVLDQPALDGVMVSQPTLYFVGRNSTMYRKSSFWISIAYAVWQSGVIFFFSYLVYRDTDIDLWSFGFLIFTGLICTNEAYLSLEVKSWSWAQAGSIAASILLYIIFALVYNAAVTPDFNVADPPIGVAENMMSNPIFYLSIFFIVILSNLPKFVIRIMKNCFWPSPVLLASVKYRKSLIL